MPRRGRHLHQPRPQGPDGRTRPGVLVRVGQSAQGRRPERDPDRRDVGGAGPARQAASLTAAVLPWLWLLAAGRGGEAEDRVLIQQGKAGAFPPPPPKTAPLLKHPLNNTGLCPPPPLPPP